jgi:CheY-like chemotaxis protein
MGVELTVAEGAAEAMAILGGGPTRSRPFDAIVLDFTMPDVDGVDLGKAIREQRLAEGAPIVLLSSACEPAALSRVRELGCFDVLRKPIKQRELTALLLGIRGVAEDKPVAAASGPPVCHLGLRILLAEDNPINQRVARLMLQGMGCTVVTAGDGVEALERFRAARLDAVLMDCQMPRLGGIDATGEIRKLEAAETRAPTPIIALTANSLETDRQHCLSAGMNEFLIKPLRAAALQEALQRLVGSLSTGAVRAPGQGNARAEMAPSR